MNKLNIVRLLTVFVLVVGFGAIPSQQASGAVTLSTALVGKMVNGEAWYITYGKDSSAFFTWVEHAEPNAILRVTIQRGGEIRQITTMQADKYGEACVVMYTSIPVMLPKDMIEVWQGSEPVAAGYLAVVVPVID